MSATRLLRVAEVAAATGLTRARIYEAIRHGLLPAVRLGRQVLVAESAYEAWVASGGQPLPPRSDA
jgi:excisionase family DNA binding protein